jgi:HSP20 family protein
MAEPQATSQADKARIRGETTSAQAGEPRSFDEVQRTRGLGETPAQSASEMGRGLAESGRLAGRQMAEAWRMAFDPLLSAQYDMTRMFDEVWRQTFGFRQPQTANPMRAMGLLGAGLFGLPPTDVRETSEAHVLEIELPGLKPEDVDVSVETDALVICGQKTEETADATAAYRINERRFGHFERMFPLPADVDRKKIQAQFRDGVLRITLPKNAATAPQRSKIEVRG